MDVESQEDQHLDSAESPNSWKSMGWFLLILGSCLFVLNALEAVQSLNWMPSVWSVNRTLWWMIAILLLCGGLYIISRLRTTDEDDAATFH